MKKKPLGKDDDDDSSGPAEDDSSSSEDSPRFDKLRHRKFAKKNDQPKDDYLSGRPKTFKYRSKSSRLKSMKKLNDGCEVMGHPSPIPEESNTLEEPSKDRFRVSIKVKAPDPSHPASDSRITPIEQRRPSVISDEGRRLSVPSSHHQFISKQLGTIPGMILLRPPSDEFGSTNILLDGSQDGLNQNIDTPPRGSPRLSPKISPRLMAANMKRKLSEAILLKPENLSFLSDQMVSVSYKSLESFVTEDNLPGLESFLSSRTVVIDDRDENGTTALIFSALKGKSDFCKVLIDHGADINAEDNDQWSALITAAKEGHKDTVQTLINYGANIHQRDIGGWTALIWACYQGNADAVKILLSHGADPNAQGQHHMTSLIWAAGRGHIQVVEELLSKSAKVNLGDKFGTTPLIWACRKGYYEIAEKLLKRGANADATGMYSWTSLLVATKGNYLALVHLLLDQKPALNASDKDGGTALTIACKEGFSEVASALLRAGAYVNLQDRNGDTNLIYASRGGHKTVVESLLKRHADTDLVGKEKKTALYWAVEKSHTPIVKVLLTSNADMEHSTKEGDTALLKAVRNKNSEIVQLLIDRKARVNVADKKGDTALHIAMRGRSKKIVEILLRNPKNSQMLYRPNRAGETPYNIDLSHQKTILGQIFGARRLNTNEENENMLGYDLYSSSMADILSEPSLSMPISVGLYARWGSGKSFLVRKLKEEMNSFARQWVEPLFQFTSLVFLLCIIVCGIVGFIILMATSKDMWYIGPVVGATLFILILLILLAIWYGSRSKYDWHFCYRWSVALASQMASFKVVMQVIFCSPPGDHWKELKDGVQAKPLKFIFAEGAKPSSTGAGGNSVIQILGSLFDMLEHQYGIFPTRFYRAFRPKAQGSSSSWKYRRLCGIPYIAIFFITLLCALTLTYLAVTYGFHGVGHSGMAMPLTTTPLPILVKNLDKTALGDQEGFRKIARRATRNTLAIDEDDEDEDEDEDDEEEGGGYGSTEVEGEDEMNFDDEDLAGRPIHGKLVNPLLFILSALVALVVVANIHTFARMVRALIFSHKRHLLSAMSKFDTSNAEGYLPTLKSETNLMTDMVKCLDAFTTQQTRLVVILDGLDSCEQEKVLTVLESVHSLFTDSNGPFIILLAIDPHIITRAIELNASKVFRESSISGHDYLRNIIHLPFYLQNAGLRKVKQAEQASEIMKGRSHGTWHEQETEVVSLATTSAMGGLHHMSVSRHMSSASELGYSMPSNRRMSTESGLSIIRRNTSKGSRRLKQSDSVGSSIASNLHRVSAASDLNKVLLTDDYFNDINPRSMRRLMNVVYIAGRLLKAFHIDFNWYHLALWVNITEQWPYRASWLIHYYEKNEESMEEKTSLKDLYDRVKCRVPISKETEPLLEMDRDEKKFETFLSMHENVLFVCNLVVFLPFTINLDPFIKKRIKEDELQMDESGGHSGMSLPWHLSSHDHQSRSSSLSYKGKGLAPSNTKPYSQTLPQSMNPLMWGYNPPFYQPSMPMHTNGYGYTSQQLPALAIHQTANDLPAEAQDKKLSTLAINDIFDLLKKVDGISDDMLPEYKEKFITNNINGKVVLHCNLDDLKKILGMTFGDWELFKMLILGLRDLELSNGEDLTAISPHPTCYPTDSFSDQSEADSSLFRRGSLRGSKEKEDSATYAIRRAAKHVIHAKQVTLEDQMIFGALQTLNEEAFEDVVEEQAKHDALAASYHLAALQEDAMSTGGRNSRSGSFKKHAEEVDVVYLKSSPLLPHTVISCPPDEESAANSLASSISPYKGSISLSRASSLRGDSTSTSPRHSAEEHLISAAAKDAANQSHRKVFFSSSATSSPLKRDRPQSLYLNQNHMESNDVINQSPMSMNSENDLEEYGSSFSDIFPQQNGPRSRTLAEQISSGSSASIGRIKRLTKRFHKALVTHDEPSDKCVGEDLPIVYSPAPSNSSPINQPETVSNQSALYNNASVGQLGSEEDLLPVDTQGITSQNPSVDDKETHL